MAIKHKYWVSYEKFETLAEAEDAAKRMAIRDGEGIIYTATTRYTLPALADMNPEKIIL